MHCGCRNMCTHCTIAIQISINSNKITIRLLKKKKKPNCILFLMCSCCITVFEYIIRRVPGKYVFVQL